MATEKERSLLPAMLLGQRLGLDQTESGPLLVTAKTAAALCGKSLRTWRTWDVLGLIPRPVRIKRSTLWRLNELKSWVAAGCPRRSEWEARHGELEQN
jgi:predicted DNA-binding transcriptional regulator AlpA